MKIRKFFLSLLCHASLAFAGEPLDHSLHELQERGFTVLHNLFTQEEVDQMAGRFQGVKKRAFEILENTPPVIRLFGETNQSLQTKYWATDRELILQAGFGRYDLYRGFSQDLFSSMDFLQNSKIEQLMAKSMVSEFTCYSGIIYSMAGSEDQYWHRDTNTLDNEGSNGSKLVLLDDFYFTVLIPITVPFTLENGTTEFMEGSHKLSAEDSKNCEKVRFEVPLGSAVVFNGKIIHRGKANNSLEDRPALYIVYHKKWYNDQYRKGVI